MATGDLGDLPPEGAVARGEESVFAGIPTQKMGRVHVLGVRSAAGPDFVEQIAAWRIDRTVQVETEAALLLS